MNRMITRAAVATLACLLLAAGPAGAATITVGTGETYTTIQSAINYLATVDPDGGYHTIQLKAETYSPATGEASQAVTRYEGAAPTLLNINNNLGASNYLDNLHIVGTGAGSTIIDAQGSADGLNGSDATELSVFYVDNISRLYVSNLTITGGALDRYSGGDTASNTNGLGLDTNAPVTLSNVAVTGNASAGGGYGGSYRSVIALAGGAAGSVIENCTVTGNTVVGEGLNSGIGVVGATAGNMNLLIANTSIVGNALSNSGANTVGAGIASRYQHGYNITVFGSLIADNTNGAAGLFGRYNGSSSTPTYYIVNSTVADNDAAGYLSIGGELARILNSVFTGDGGTTAGRIEIDKDPTRDRRLDLLNTNVDDADFTYGAYIVDGYPSGNTGTNPLDPADLAHVGSSATPDTYYALTLSSPGYEGGRLGDGVTYLYVDINNDGSYDEGFDIVVAGTPPADPDGDDRVYLLDLAGNARVNGTTIDMGAYEYAVPEPATVAFLGLGGLAMAAGAIRRRRRAA